MGELKLQENFAFTLDFEINGEVQTHLVEETKILVGSSELCDIKIKHPGVRHFHCVIIKKDDHLLISKLDAKNHLLINSQEADSGYLKFGDKFQISGFEVNINSKVLRQAKKASAKVLRLKTKPVQTLKNNENYLYVDGEYVDSSMTQEHYKKSKNIILDNMLIKSDEFVSPDAPKLFDLHSGQDAITSNKSLDIIFTSFGNIISYDSVPFLNMDNYWKYLSNELTEYLEINEKSNFLKFDGSHVSVENCGSMTISKDSDESIGERQDLVIFEKGVNQVFFRVGQVVNPMKNISGDVRDREEKVKMIGLIFALFLPLMMMNYFYTAPEIIKEKDVVIIYKQKKVVKKKLVQKSNDAKDIDKTAKKEAKKVSEKKTDNSKTKQVKKLSQAKKSAPKKKSVKASSKAKAAPKVAFASSFSKMLGSSTVKSKSFEKNSKSKGTTMGNLATSKSGSLSTVGGGSSVKGLATSSQFGSGKGFKSKGAAKKGFDSKFTSKRTVVLGAIDPSIIDRILRENMPQFRYCYQQELVRNPKTSGKITTNFTIGSNGRVSKSSLKGNFSGSGVGCMKKVFSNIQFPKPKGGGVVQVKKPFTFSASKTSV